MLTKKAKLLKQTEEKRICLEKNFIEKRLAQWRKLPFFSVLYPFFQWSTVYPFFQWSIPLFFTGVYPFFLFLKEFIELSFSIGDGPAASGGVL
jgi:hypothetical protein